MKDYKVVSKEVDVKYLSFETVKTEVEAALASLPKDAINISTEFDTYEEYEVNKIVLTITYSIPKTEEDFAKEKSQKQATLLWKRQQLEKLKKELGE